MSIRARVISALVALPLAAVAMTACGSEDAPKPATTVVQSDAAAQPEGTPSSKPVASKPVPVVHARTFGTPAGITDAELTVTSTPDGFVVELLTDGTEVVLDGKFVATDSAGAEHVGIGTAGVLKARGYSGDRYDFGTDDVVSITYTGNGTSVTWVAN